MSRTEAKERRREQVLAAAEAFIRRDGSVDFSMKDLANDAKVSFATPFNLFGKKEDILAALFNKRVSEQAAINSKRASNGDGLEHLMRIALDSCNAYLSDAELFRPLAQSFRMQRTPQLVAVSQSAQAIWKEALERCQEDKLISEELDLSQLARRLHISFRVAFGMWASNEIKDSEFRQQALYNTVSCLLPHTTNKGRQKLTALIEIDPHFRN